MGKIVLLDELTINQIAAGEVIERPASVVKEMVENSIDAGASNICVDIKNGGISSIRITDNGKGIAPDDMEIAFERHATSKIRTAEDLTTVKSMGFRGEALASIASIANVEMISRTEDEEFGQKIVVEAGKLLEREEVGAGVGTTITVKNLFFNTPVRYKFLKKDYTETGYIEDAITRLALINPNIAFKLTNNEKTIIQTTGDGNIKNCIYSIFGKEIANGIIDVNKRYEKDKTLSASIEQAYKGMLTIGKHAFCIINIDLNPSEVDVNVHPAKLEVRFKEENKVFKAIYHGVKEALLTSDLVVHTEKSEEQTRLNEVQANIPAKFREEPENNSRNKFASLFKRKPQELNWEKEEVSERLNLVEALYNQKKEENTVQKTEQQMEQNIQGTEERMKPEVQGLEIRNEQFNALAENKDGEKRQTTEEMNYKFEEMYEKTFGKKITDKLQEEGTAYSVENKVEQPQIGQVTEESAMTTTTETVKELQKQEQQNMFENKETFVEPVKYKFIGIVFSTYIILEIDKEMYILDQHAAHERIMYEKIKKNFYNNEAKDSQLMLLPDIITLTHKEMDIARSNYQMFEQAGFTLEEFGENTIKLTGVPNICIDLDTKELFMNILDEIDTVAVTARQQIEEKFIATVACKAAVKANMALDAQEVEALMNELLKLPNPFTCPHGRPTAIRMSKFDIERKFSRR